MDVGGDDARVASCVFPALCSGGDEVVGGSWMENGLVANFPVVVLSVTQYHEPLEE